MGTTLHKIVFLLLFALSLQSCELGQGKDPILVADVDKEFDFALWEVLNKGVRHLQLNISSIKEKECLNYRIDQNMRQNGPNISLNINQIIAPEICERGVGPAKGAIDLNPLPNGRYNLSVNLGKIVPSKGTLTINPDSYIINMPDQFGFRLLQTTLNRIPDQTIWGFIAYQDDTRNAANEFIAELNKISQLESLPKGYYGYFSVGDNGEMNIAQPPIDRPIITFSRNFTDTDAKLEALVKSFRNKYPQSLLINLNNTDGKVF
jgi:hypothetical protein